MRGIILHSWNPVDHVLSTSSIQSRYLRPGVLFFQSLVQSSISIYQMAKLFLQDCHATVQNRKEMYNNAPMNAHCNLSSEVWATPHVDVS